MRFEKWLSLWLLPLLIYDVRLHAQDVKQPESPILVAMAWGVEDDTSGLEDIEFWNANGEPIDSVSLIGELTTTLTIDLFRPKLNREVDHLRPLILIFRQPENSTISKVGPILNKESEKFLQGWTMKPVANTDLFVTPIIPLTETHPVWDESSELTIKFAFGKPELKVVKEQLTERQEILSGLWVGLSQVHRETRFSFEFDIMNRGQFPKVAFDFWIEHENGEIEKPNMAITRRLDGVDLLCLSTKPVQPDKVKSISASRTVFVYEPIGRIRIPKDSLDDK